MEDAGTSRRTAGVAHLGQWIAEQSETMIPIGRRLFIY